MYASLFGICPQKTRTPHLSGGSPVSGALHLDGFEQPEHQVFFNKLLEALGVTGGMGKGCLPQIDKAGFSCIHISVNANLFDPLSDSWFASHDPVRKTRGLLMFE